MSDWMKKAGRAKRMRELAAHNGWICHYCLMPLCDIDTKELYRHEYTDEEFTSYWYELPDELKWPTLDHKIPRSKGGNNELANLVLCCPHCNSLKGHRRTYDEFYRSRENVRAHRATA